MAGSRSGGVAVFAGSCAVFVLRACNRVLPPMRRNRSPPNSPAARASQVRAAGARVSRAAFGGTRAGTPLFAAPHETRRVRDNFNSTRNALSLRANHGAPRGRKGAFWRAKAALRSPCRALSAVSRRTASSDRERHASGEYHLTTCISIMPTRGVVGGGGAGRALREAPQSPTRIHGASRLILLFNATLCQEGCPHYAKSACRPMPNKQRIFDINKSHVGRIGSMVGIAPCDDVGNPKLEIPADLGNPRGGLARISKKGRRDNAALDTTS